MDPARAVAISVAYFAALWMFWPQRGDSREQIGITIAAFGRLPVIDGGRCKPLDTAARMNLMVLTHRQQFYNPETQNQHYPATKWYLRRGATTSTHCRRKPGLLANYIKER